MQPRREKEDRQRARSWPRAALSACVAVSAGCGAKTGLTVPCSIEVVTTKPEIVLVLDRSSSLVDGTADGIRLVDAVKGATLRVIPQLDGAASLGLILFPAVDDAACGGDARWNVPLGETTASAISREVRSMEAFGLTPTFSAVHLAANELRSRAASAPHRRRFLVLATDGGANCNNDIPLSECRCTTDPVGCASSGGAFYCLDDRRVANEVRQLRAEGIDTIVIGFRADLQSPFYLDFLQTVALAGGAFGGAQVPYLSADREAQIDAVLSQALLEPPYCELTLSNGAQRMPDALVTEGMHVERGVRDGNGWNTVPAHPERIRLHGTLCQHAVSQRILSWRGVWNQRCVMYP